MMAFLTHRSPSSVLLLSVLFVYCCVLASVLRDVEAVNVGEPDAQRRHLVSAASGSGAGADLGDACPTATTIEVANATTASSSSSIVKITTGGSDSSATCKSEVVKSVVVTTGANADKSHVLLDVHGKGIVVVKSVPVDVQIL